MKWKIIQSCFFNHQPVISFWAFCQTSQTQGLPIGTQKNVFPPFDASKHLSTPLQFHFISGSFLCEDEANPFEICAPLKWQAAWNIQKISWNHTRKLHPVENHNITTYISSFLELLDLWTAESLSEMITSCCSVCGRLRSLHTASNNRISALPTSKSQQNVQRSVAQQSMPSFKQRFSKTQKVQ